jgi:hypothetical membrane protein
MADAPAPHPRPYRALACCGILPPLVDVAVIAAVAAVQPDYSHVRQFISELGETGRPHAALVSAWWFAFSFLMSPFAIALVAALPWGRWRWGAPAAIVAFAVLSGAGSWLFPCDPGCKGETFAGMMHFVVNYIATAAMFLGPLLLWLSTRRAPRWKRLSRFSLAMHFLLIISLGALSWSYYGWGSTATELQAVQGLLQRAFLGLFYVWLMILSASLLRRIQSTGVE